MLIGNGLLAKYFISYQNDDSFLVFASGVSNSKTTNQHDFDREKKLLEENINKSEGKCFVYFSTCSINDPDLSSSPYVLHKKSMESLIAQNAKHFYIFRLSNVVANIGNPNTILNFLFYNILHNQEINVWKHSERNLIDVETVFKIVNFILKKGLFKNEIINIANPSNYLVTDIVFEIELFLNQKGNYHLIEKGESFNIDTKKIMPILDQLGELKQTMSIQALLHKYYNQAKK